MRRIVVALVSALVVTGAALVPSGRATAVDVSEPLQLDGFAELVVAPLSSRVFVSQGTDTVVVADADGHQVESLQIADATDMALSADGLQLFVASEGSRQVTAVDTLLLTTRVIDLGTRSDDSDRCASDVAVSAGVLWVIDRCTKEQSGRATVVAVDLSGNVTTTDIVGETRVFADPRAPGALFVGSGVYDVTGGSTPTATRRPGAGPLASGQVQAVTADGADVLVVEPSGYRRTLRYDVDDLGHDGSYAARDPQAVAVRGDGVVAVGSHDGTRRYFGEDDPDPFLVEHVNEGPPQAMAFVGRNLVVVVGNLVGGDPPVLMVRQAPLVALPGVASPYARGGSLLDEANGRMLHMTDGGSLLVTDLDGSVTGTVPLMGPAGIIGVPSRSVAYVPLSTSAAIAEIDLSSLAVRRIPLTPSACPEQGAFVGGLLYFVDVCAERDGLVNTSRIDALDPVTGQVFRDVIEVEAPASAVGLVASDRSPGLLLVSEWSQVRAVDVSGGFEGAAVLGRTTMGGPVTFDADGRALQADMERYRLPDLARIGRGSCDSVAAVRDDGLTICHSTVYNEEGRLSVYAPGANHRYASAQVPFDRGVGVHAGARDVYAVGNGPDGVDVLRFDPSRPTVAPLRATSYLAVQAPAAPVTGEPFEVRVDLHTPEPDATVVVELVAMSDAGPRRTVLANGRVDSRGVFTARVNAPFAGYVAAVYAGADGIDGAREFAPSRVQDPVHDPLAVRLLGARRRADGTHAYVAGSRLTLEVRGAGADRGCVRLRTQVRGPHGWSRAKRSTCTQTRRKVKLSVPVARRPGQFSRTRAELVAGPGDPDAFSRWVVLRRVRR